MADDIKAQRYAYTNLLAIQTLASAIHYDDLPKDAHADLRQMVDGLYAALNKCKRSIE